MRSILFYLQCARVVVIYIHKEKGMESARERSCKNVFPRGYAIMLASSLRARSSSVSADAAEDA